MKRQGPRFWPALGDGPGKAVKVHTRLRFPGLRVRVCLAAISILVACGPATLAAEDPRERYLAYFLRNFQSSTSPSAEDIRRLGELAAALPESSKLKHAVLRTVIERAVYAGNNCIVTVIGYETQPLVSTNLGLRTSKRFTYAIQEKIDGSDFIHKIVATIDEVACKETSKAAQLIVGKHVLPSSQTYRNHVDAAGRVERLGEVATEAPESVNLLFDELSLTFGDDDHRKVALARLQSVGWTPATAEDRAYVLAADLTRDDHQQSLVQMNDTAVPILISLMSRGPYHQDVMLEVLARILEAGGLSDSNRTLIWAILVMLGDPSSSGLQNQPSGISLSLTCPDGTTYSMESIFKLRNLRFLKTAAQTGLKRLQENPDLSTARLQLDSDSQAERFLAAYHAGRQDRLSAAQVAKLNSLTSDEDYLVRATAEHALWRHSRWGGFASRPIVAAALNSVPVLAVLFITGIAIFSIAATGLIIILAHFADYLSPGRRVHR